MASQVFSGSSNFSYTNNTGQNVRVVINFMRKVGGTTPMSINWAGTGASSTLNTIGRNLAFSILYGSVGGAVANNADGSASANTALPTEIMLAPGQTFSASNISAYNIVVIPEAG
jgi:hypothetical protein